MQARKEIDYAAQAALQHESLGRMISDLANQSAGLVRDEVALAKQELQEKALLLRSSMILIGTGAFFGLLASLAICTAIIVALAEYTGLWQAALIVGAACAIGAAILAFVGIGKLKNNSLKPQQTIETLEEDKEWLKRLT